MNEMITQTGSQTTKDKCEEGVVAEQQQSAQHGAQVHSCRTVTEKRETIFLQRSTCEKTSTWLKDAGEGMEDGRSDKYPTLSPEKPANSNILSIRGGNKDSV